MPMGFWGAKHTLMKADSEWELFSGRNLEIPTMTKKLRLKINERNHMKMLKKKKRCLLYYTMVFCALCLTRQHNFMLPQRWLSFAILHSPANFFLSFARCCWCANREKIYGSLSLSGNTRQQARRIGRRQIEHGEIVLHVNPREIIEWVLRELFMWPISFSLCVFEVKLRLWQFLAC